MNRWTLIRDHIVTALGTLAFGRDVVIEPVSRPTGVNAISGPTVIGVCRVGGRAVGPFEIGYHKNQPAEMQFQIVIRTDSALTSTSGLDEAEDIGRIVLGMRNTDIGIYNTGYEDLNTGGVFLDYVADSIVEFTGREPGGAGPLILILTMKTTELPM